MAGADLSLADAIYRRHYSLQHIGANTYPGSFHADRFSDTGLPVQSGEEHPNLEVATTGWIVFILGRHLFRRLVHFTARSSSATFVDWEQSN